MGVFDYGNDDETEIDDGFDNYIPKTNDPGPLIFICVCLYSLLCLLVLPLFVICGKKREKRRLDREEWGKVRINKDSGEDNFRETKEEIDHNGVEEAEFIEPAAHGGQHHKVTKTRNASSKKANGLESRFNSQEQCDNMAHDSVLFGGRASVISAHSSVISTRSKRHGRRGRINYANLYTHATASEEIHELAYGATTINEGRNYFKSDDSKMGKKAYHGRDDGSVTFSQVFNDVRPEDAPDANDPGKGQTHHGEIEEEQELTICLGQNFICSRKNIRYYYGFLADIAHIDNETKRLIQLGWPMTLSEVIDALLEAVSVAIIANYLGTEALTAYVLSELLIGLSDEFISGPSEALNTLCAHAIGAENYILAGQYVQIAAVIYLIMGIPSLAVWYIWIGDVVLLMGLSDKVALITAQYTKIIVWHYLLSGLFDGYNALLDITGYVTIGAILDIIYGLIDVTVLWIMCKYWDGVNLVHISLVELGLSIVFFILYTLLVICQGWLSRFTKGMLGTFALGNRVAVRNMIATALPLSFGSVLEYGEWEVLTFFVAYLGEAEIAAWGLLESIWDIFESATEGISEAASIRLAYHLGKGNIQMAKLSSYKSLFLATNLSIFLTSLLFLMGDDLPNWFTNDTTLRTLLYDVIPMIGIGNILMVIGMTSWTLIGAQGRYKVATLVSIGMTFCVTLPLAAISTFVFTFDLRGIVGSMVCGYSTTGLVLGYILFRSDWEHISETIQEYNAEEDSSDSDDDYSDSSDDDDDSDSSDNDDSDSD